MNDGNKSWPTTILWPLLCGVAYALAFEPGVGFNWLGFQWLGHMLVLISVLAFLMCLRQLTPRQARFASFIFGLSSFSIGTSWLWNIFGGASLALWSYLALFPAVFAGSLVWVRQRCETMRGWAWLEPLVVGCLWTSVEYVRSEWAWLDFPWMTIAHARGPSVLLPIVGAYGSGFVIVVILAAVKSTLSDTSRWGNRLALTALLFLAIDEIPFLGTTSVHNRGITVAALQAEGTMFEGYEAMTKGLTQHADVIVWPEYALAYDVMKSKRDSAALLALAAEKKATLIVGTETIGDGENWWNTALTLDANGERGRHFKQHTVHLFDDGTPGTTALPVPTNHGLIGTPICFDNDYQNVVREMTAAGAEFFAVPSMDPAHWGMKQHLQHGEMFRLRAAENGRWMVVASSSGVTQLIDPNGYVHGRLEPLTRGVLTGQLVALKEQTFFTRYGWRFPWVCIAGALLAVGTALWRGRVRVSRA